MSSLSLWLRSLKKSYPVMTGMLMSRTMRSGAMASNFGQGLSRVGEALGEV